MEKDGIELHSLIPIEFRPITDNDQELLYHIYAMTRMEEVKLTGWDDHRIEWFLRMQFKAQHLHYMKNYSHASFDIIRYHEVSIGRLYVHRCQVEIRIIDIALLPEYRNQGIGSRIMKALIEESERKGIPLTLHVESNNPAQHFYSRLGFAKADDIGIYHFMRRIPQTTAQKGG
ncbi:MAG: GNAT family N-acetyltransferase [Candidatus Delongbacteria bacterium]|nr:GNAT family N-acetyltransferase [Candidatus Delongbacteria bacterium]